MARFFRASLLLTTLGVASLALPASTAVAANAGGAAPGDVVGTSTPPPPPGSNGGAKAGAQPPQTASSARTGGAKAGHKPHRRVIRHPVKPKRHTTKPPVAATPTPPADTTIGGVFPLLGAYSFGGDDARFGAGRTGHIHQGQDVLAASTTPIVAPLAGSVLWKANQPCCAGIYLVEHGSDGRDYVFMHIKRGTVLVKVGDPVTAGQQLAQVGATGDASGPHLHFEIWVGGWFVKGGHPIDPLPQLRRWAGLAPQSS
jgi:murein DD-endopeptidase MepM/ murein hydrolase activator NlpD